VSSVFFQKLAGEVPEIGRELVRLLAATMTATHELVASVLEQEAIARVAGCLIDISRRLERAGLDGSRFRVGVSRRDIASYLGMTIETVSRSLTELSRRRLIEVRAKELRLLRPPDLQLIAS
jgi:CRP/FNR family transcriptional regulator, anaerobic regulatory protein